MRSGGHGRDETEGSRPDRHVGNCFFDQISLLLWRGASKDCFYAALSGLSADRPDWIPAPEHISADSKTVTKGNDRSLPRQGRSTRDLHEGPARANSLFSEVHRQDDRSDEALQGEPFEAGVEKRYLCHSEFCQRRAASHRL